MTSRPDSRPARRAALTALCTKKGEAYLDKVVFKVVPEAGVRTSSLQSGQVDAISSVGTADETALKGGQVNLLRRANPGNVFNLGLNNSRPLLKDVKVRRAILFAIDRQQIVHAVFPTGTHPAISILAHTTPDYANLGPALSYDAAKAKSLLDSAGWKAGSGGTRTKNGAERIHPRAARGDPRRPLHHGRIRTVESEGARMTVQDTTAELSAFTRDWQEWHTRQEARLADPHGFLAITGLHWLSDEPQRFPDAPGAWSTGTDGVVVVLDDGEELVLDGAPVRGEHRFGVLPERGGVNAIWGDAVIEVAKRGGHDILRPRHPDTPLRIAFTGTPSYAPHPRWAVTGRYTAFDEPRPTTVGAAVEGLEHVYDAPGRVEFELDGRPLTLTAFPGHSPGSLLVLFTDATSGVTTYAANRALALDPPAADGTVILDFNRATNLPCAYTDLATCPLPPTENRLPVAIKAGEKIPHERGGS